MVMTPRTLQPNCNLQNMPKKRAKARIDRKRIKTLLTSSETKGLKTSKRELKTTKPKTLWTMKLMNRCK